MTRYRVLPYKQGSKSAKALATALGGKVLKLEGSTFKCGLNDLVVNWGNANCAAMVDNMTKHLEYPDEAKVFNWHGLDFASNKLKFFELMKDTGLTPEHWTAKEDIPDEAFPVVCRTVLTGHSGAGIIIADIRNDLVDAPLYVKYEKKKEEYRIHVGRKRVFVGGDDHGSNTGWDEQIVTIAVQRKARRLDTPLEEVDWQVRNLAGGFIYQREGFTVPASAEQIARDCLRQTGLDFGAVDVIWNAQKEKAYVLEINTAPGLEGSTVTDYAEFFKGSI